MAFARRLPGYGNSGFGCVRLISPPATVAAPRAVSLRGWHFDFNGVQNLALAASLSRLLIGPAADEIRLICRFVHV